MTGWQSYAAYRAGAAHTVCGAVVVQPGFYSPQLDNRRDLLVYLPPDYESGERRYPVIYMHDGQNLFDAETSYGGEWQVDETMATLSAEGLAAIVVGIPNMGEQRIAEYSPFVDAQHGGGRGENYVRFLVETVKPRIDSDFRTLPGRAHSGVMGSSMGGLISLYAFLRFPEVFGFVGAMSPSIWYANGAIVSFVRRTKFVGGRIYLDTGTAEGRFGPPRYVPRLLSRHIGASVEHVYGILLQHGYRAERDIRYIEEEGAPHSEAAWAHRLPAALRFLLAIGG